MKNYNSVNKEELIDEFRKKETLRSVPLERISVDLENRHAHQLETQRQLMEFRQDRENIEILNTQLIQRSRELEEANIKLKLANRELEAFNFMVSHDLRTPLSTILLCAQAVFRHCGNNLDEQCQTYIRSIFSQTKYMNQLLNSLMEFSRASCKEIQKERVDLSSITSKIAANLRLNDPERTVNFNIMADIEVSGDKCLLQKVLENLIGNAWKYTGLKESSTIEFGVTGQEGKPAYFVRDNGIGFDMNQAAKLFGIFKRLHCKDEFNGYGVGLAAVKRIIQRHGGEVWAEGKVGKGATVYFSL
jgi:light-regulated signal transduction histidine kinase (bacteriophytochrome)